MAHPPQQRLPQEIVAPCRPRELIGIATAVLALLVIANVAAAFWLRDHSPNPVHQQLRAKWHLLDSIDEGTNQLVLGDSSGNQGVVPDILAETLGGTWVNLCTIGDMMLLDDAWMLAEHIERNGPPKRVLIVHNYDVWKRRPRGNAIAQIPRPWGYWADAEPGVEFGTEDQALALGARYFPLYMADQSLERLVKFPWQALRPLEIGPDGFMAVKDSNPALVKRELQEHVELMKGDPFEVSPENRAAAKRLAEMAELHEFPVYFATAPLYDKLIERDEFTTYFRGLDRWLDELEGMSPRFSVLVRRPVPQPIESLESVDHMTEAGAREFTETLANLVAEHER